MTAADKVAPVPIKNVLRFIRVLRFLRSLREPQSHDEGFIGLIRPSCARMQKIEIEQHLGCLQRGKYRTNERYRQPVRQFAPYTDEGHAHVAHAQSIIA